MKNFIRMRSTKKLKPYCAIFTFCFLCCLVFALCAPSLHSTQAAPAHKDNIVIVATIKPLHGLLAALLHNVGEPRLLLKGGQSPHSYALKPSDARLLKKADLIVQIDPKLETFLVKTLNSLARGGSVLTVSALAGLQHWPLRQKHHHHGHDEHNDEHNEEDSHSDNDLHYWLDPANGRLIAKALAHKLNALYPAHKKTIQTNLHKLDQELIALEQELTALFKATPAKPYLVYHDAYQYFERRFNLAPESFIALDPTRKAGARHLSKLVRLVASHPKLCLFQEPQFAASKSHALFQQKKVTISELDPLGAALPAGPGFYPALLRKIARKMTQCFRA